MTSVKWRKGGIHGELLMSYTSDSNQTTIEDGNKVEFIDGFNSVGMVLLNAAANASGNYTVIVTLSDHGQDYSMTSLTMITSM
jgi:hypothetical protein